MTTPSALHRGRQPTPTGPPGWPVPDLFTTAVTVVGATRADPLTPTEAAAVASAHRRRREDFALGRTCVRRALSALGVPPTPVLPLATGAPDWPPGVVGSISHCAHGAVAAVTWRARTAGLGIDVEEAGAVTADLLVLVCTPPEVAALRRLPGGAPRWATVLFSAKETVFKALLPVTGTPFDWADVVVELSLGSSRFRARVRVPGQREPQDVAGRFACTRGHVWTGLALPPPELRETTARGRDAQEDHHG